MLGDKEKLENGHVNMKCDHFYKPFIKCFKYEPQGKKSATRKM